MSIKKSSTQLAANSNTPVLHFNFSKYEDVLNKVCHNNAEVVDFVTANGSLYVCAVDGTKPTNANIDEQEGFLLIIKHGEDGSKGEQGVPGIPGVSPNISVRFNGRVLQILEDGAVVASSADLTGPAWRPVLNGTKLSWERSRDFDRTPQSIDLEELRPVDAKPLLLRVDSDNTKRADEVSGPARFIQWKHEGDKEWTNLIAINELMNLALAGVSFWQDENDHKWHFGHRQVIQAEYTSDSKGQQIISHVELGDVFYDAGPIDIANTEIDVQDILNRLTVIEGELRNIPVVDAYTKQQSDAKYQLKGNYLTEHQSLKTINGNSLVGTGNITISVGETSLFDVRFDASSHKLQKTTDGQNWIDLVDLDDYTGGTGGGMTESEVKHLIGQVLEGVLDSAIPEYVKGNDHNYFIRLNDLANYTTADDVAAMIRDAMTGQNVDYYRVFTLYQRTNSPTVAPSKPVTGVWEWNTAAAVDTIALKPNHSSAWTNHPENATTSTPYLWITSATYSYATKSEVGQDPWETPICLTAEPGEDGADGDSVEFIYILCTEAEFNSIKNTTPVAEHGDNRPDDLPTYTTSSGNGWTDHPSGISETYPIEAVSIRTKDDGTWSSYSNPTIWSMWGEDGMDGDGVEYIFFVAPSDLVNVDQVSGRVSLPTAVYYSPNSQNFIPTEQSMVINLGPSYQVPDWIQVADNNWTDNPSDVDEGQPFEFVSIRKYHDGTGWGPFCTPKLWSHYGGITVTPTEIRYGETSYRPYTCYAFCRTNTDISNYTVEYDFSEFASVEHPNPTYSDLTDNQKIQFYENPQDYTKTLNTNNQDTHITWNDTVPIGTTQLWLITAHIGDENQVSDTGWTSPVKWGDQAGINVEYSVDEKAAAVYANPSLWNSNHLTFNDFAGTDEQREALWEDAVRSQYGDWSDNITDPVYMATTVLQSNGVWSDWVIAKIKGEPGTPGTPGTSGQDGTEIEFIYYRTKQNTAPGISTTKYYKNGAKSGAYDQVDDALPQVSGVATADKDPGRSGNTEGSGYWHDNPAGVSSTWTHEWVSSRRTYYSNGVKYWDAFYTPATLWSKYGDTGKDGDGIEYVFFKLTSAQAESIDVNQVVLPTRLSDTSYTDSHNPPKHINESECLPSITLTVGGQTVTIEALDDNPGITENYPYIYASMRKYNGTERAWGEFSPIQLWLIDNSVIASTNVTLDINNSEQPVQVDSNNNIIKGTDPIFLYTQQFSRLRTDIGELLDWGKIYIGKITQGGVIFDENPAVTFNANRVATIVNQDSYDNNITRSIRSATGSENRYYQFVFSVSFPANHVLSDSYVVPIKVVDSSNTFIGIDYLKFNPVHSDKLVTLNYLDQTNVIKKASVDATTYSPSSISIKGSVFGDSTFDTVSKFTYSYQFDNNPSVTFDQPVINKATVIQNKSAYYYFDANGNELGSSTGAFATLHIWNTDDNQREYDEWLAQMTIVLNGNLINDKVVLGVGYNRVLTDWETSYVIYPGKNGNKGDTTQDAYFLTEVYDETNGSWATWFENIRNGVSGYSWVPGELVQKWVVNIGTAIQTDTPVTLEQPTMTPTLKYLWKTSRTVTYNGNTPSYGNWSIPVLASQTGPQGEPGTTTVVNQYQYLDGQVMRLSDWVTNSGTNCWDGATRVGSNNQETGSLTEGTLYLDVVSYNGDYYKCVNNTTMGSTTPNNDTTGNGHHWELFSVANDTTMANLLVSNSAFINSLTSHQVVITDTVNNQTKIVAGMTSGSVAGTELDGKTTGDVRIWAGEMSNNNLTTAPFTVTSDGTLNATKANISNSATETISDVDYDEHVEIAPNKIEITHENTSNNASAGVKIRPSSTSMGDRTAATLEVWQDTTGPALGVSGVFKQRSGLFVDSITNINANSQTFNVNSNLAIITHNSGATGSGLYSTAVVPFSANSTTYTTDGAHITFLRADKGICRIQPLSGTIEIVNGTSTNSAQYIEFSSSDNRVDIIRLGDTIYAWKS